MFEIFKKSIFAGLGLAVVTKTKLESVFTLEMPAVAAGEGPSA